ncbi:MAG: hypothetical protein AB7O32_00545 [Vicinamibacterales bacterium]
MDWPALADHLAPCLAVALPALHLGATFMGGAFLADFRAYQAWRREHPALSFNPWLAIRRWVEAFGFGVATYVAAQVAIWLGGSWGAF